MSSRALVRTQDRFAAARAGWPVVLVLACILVASPSDTEIRAAVPTPANRPAAAAKIQVDEPQYDFGKSDVGTDGEHAFVVTNVGDQPLVLERGKSTCGCCTCVCTVQLPEGAVAPGESAEVTLQWKSKLYVGPFRQTATILTNDPDHREVTLSIAGRFTGPVGVVPSQLVVGSLRVGQGATRDVCIYNYLPESLDITGCELSNSQLAQYFEVTWDRLSAAEVQEEGEARSGYRVHIAIRPGLPAGTLQQSVVLQTNSKSAPHVDIPIQGAVVNDVSIVGRGWNAQTGVVSMGTIASSEGTQWPLMIVVRGPQARDVRVQHVHSDPDWLAVELEPTRYSAETGVSLTRLQIRIPPGTQPAQHLGDGQGELGRIAIQVAPLSQGELEILVRFAVRQ